MAGGTVSVDSVGISGTLLNCLEVEAESLSLWLLAAPWEEQDIVVESNALSAGNTCSIWEEDHVIWIR